MFGGLTKRMGKYLYRAIYSLNDRTLIKATKYSTRGGKFLRPMLTVLAARSLHGNIRDAMTAAISMELLHNTSLIHDDIMDNSTLRRGRVPLYLKWGKGVAITVGDANYALAFYNLSRSKNPNAMRVINELSKFTIKICAGQLLDLGPSGGIKSERKYYKTILLKTAKGFEVATKMGAIMAGGSKKEVSGLSEYGKNLGIAFQIVDDLLDVTGSEKNVGKSILNDIRENKRTLPMVYALKKSKRRGELKRLLSGKSMTEEEAKKVAMIIRESGAVEHAHEIARRYVERAVKSLKNIPDSAEKGLLIDTANRSLLREK